MAARMTVRGRRRACLAAGPLSRRLVPAKPWRSRKARAEAGLARASAEQSRPKRMAGHEKVKSGR